MTKQITHLVLNHKDRLLRFGSEIIFFICSIFGIKVTILEKKEISCQESLVQDVLELMVVFCARLYGSRSHKNKKSIA